MRHLRSGRKLNRTASHRKAMFSNLAVSILDKERVTTTTIKAKEVRSVVERLITHGKKGGLSAIRIAAKTINNKDVLKKLFDDIAPGYESRDGGYTRIIKIGERKGDNAEMAIIELVGRNDDEQRRRKKKKKVNKKKTNSSTKNEKIEVFKAEEVAEKTEIVAPKVSEGIGESASVEELVENNKKADGNTNEENEKKTEE